MKDFLTFVVFTGSFAVLFVPLFVSESMFFPFITGKNFTFRILVEIVFAAWAILALLDVRYRPRLSWLLLSTFAFLAVMLVANLQGEYPLKSFWSNYERMDGYVTLVHFFLYFVVLGSVLKHTELDVFGYKTSTWKLFLGTAVFAALWVAFTAFQQLAGNAVITQGGWRITGTLGNAAYMAIYMLFNTFIAVWLIFHSKTRAWQVFFAAAAVLFMFLLVQTATRGTIAGLAGGLMLGSLYIAIFNTQYPKIRMVAFGAVAVVVIAVAALYQFKESDFVQDRPILSRAASISLSELDLRITIWKMAVEGVKERPVLGWGQGNFNYVFNEQYVPEIYAAELWYDRAHNIFMDWLIAGGVLGLIAYLSIFLSLLWYVVVRPLVTGKSNFSVLERGILLGIIGGYFLHNLVVFDNIVSYIFFAVLLALIHSREAEVIPAIEQYRLDEKVVSHVIAPVVLVVAMVVVYLVNVPGMRAAGDILDAFTAQSFPEQLAEFESAFERESFANQEITEQLTQRTLSALNNASVPNEIKQRYAERTELALATLVADKPGDARVHTFVASYYRSIGDLDTAAKHIGMARELSPNKPAIIIEQGLTAFIQTDYDQMNAFFKEAYELETSNPDAQIFYASGLLYTDPVERVDEIVTENNWQRFATNNFAIQAADNNNHNDLMVRMLEVRISQNPDSPQIRASLAFIHHRAGNEAAAIEVLETASVDIPGFAGTAGCYVENIKAGNEPAAGC